MAYITKEYYETDYLGSANLDDKDFNRLAKRASDVIDAVTSYRLLGNTLPKQPIFIQEQVRRATAAQLEFLVINGEAAAMGAGGFGQVSAGNFSYGDKAGADALSRDQQMTSAAVINYLLPTGLLYQGVGVL